MSGNDFERADTLAAVPGKGGQRPSRPPGTVIAGRYEIVAPLGEGGMGTVYLARDRHLDELIALKLLAIEPGAVDWLDALRREVVLARRVTHRNVARTFDVGIDAETGERFLTMEYVDGESLAQIIARRRLSPERTASIVTEVGHALDAAHHAGVVHRDVKPDNVLVARNGRVVVTDFGVALGADEGESDLAGTPAYMAPELLEGRSATATSDVFSLGVVAFELVTGTRPWGVDPSLAAARKRAGLPPPDPRTFDDTLPPALAEVFAGALAAAPAARFASASTLAAALAEALAGLTRPATPTPVFQRTPTPPTARAPRIAVFPFDAEGIEDHVAGGFTEELIACLGATAAVQVLSSAAVAAIATDAAPAEQASRLAVDLVATGGLRRAGHERIVTVRVHDASGERRLLRRWQVHAPQLLTIAEEAAFEIAPLSGALSIRRGVQEVLPSDEALDLFLQARQRYYNLATADGALELYEQALALAPDSMLVKAGYARALLRVWMVDGIDPDLGRRAKEAAEASMRAAPELGDAHLAMGYVHLHGGEPVAAMQSFSRAVARSPSSPEVHAIIGGLFLEMGRVEEAQRRIATGLRLDPSQGMALMIDERLARLCNDAAAAERMDGVFVGDPQSAVAWINPIRYAAYQRDGDGLRSYAEKIASAPDRFGLRDIARQLALIFAGDVPATSLDATFGEDRLRSTGSSRRLALILQILAEVAGSVGNGARACTMIERSESAGFFDLLWLDHCPLLEPARAEPRFAAIRGRIADRCYAMYDAFWTT